MSLRSGWAVLVALVWAPAVLSAAPAHVTFVVETPAATPAGAAIWISGDVPQLGGWDGAGLRLAALGGRRFGARGGEIADREWVAAADDTVRVTVAAWRDQSESRTPRVPTRTGDIRSHPAFPSRFVRARDVLVFLPPGYDTDSTARYPVLYFHDGNNVFDAATSFLGIEWGVDETAGQLLRDGRVRPFIAVAVANTPDRVAEYTPAADRARGGGRAADYARFLVQELKPFIDAHYRAAPGPGTTGAVGSSLGGIVSLYLGLEHPEVFGLVGCLSPAARWAERDIVRRTAAGHGVHGRIWVDIGSLEGRDAEAREQALGDARALRDALLARGYREGVNLHYEEVAGAVHDERAWAARIDRVLVFLLGSPVTGTGAH